MEPELESKSNGALVGLVVIVLVLIIGGIYIWLSNQRKAVLPNETGTETSVNTETTQ